jgi:hypothetical protein
MRRRDKMTAMCNARLTICVVTNQIVAGMGSAAMDSSVGNDAPPMLELSCPEFYATEIGRIEPAGGENLRIYMCVRRGKVLEPMFTVVIPIAELARCARLSLSAAAARHTELVLMTEH